MPSPMLMVDVSTTARTGAQTGIQKVTRGLYSELRRREAGQGLLWDPFLDGWRPPFETEAASLESDPAQPGEWRRGARWPARLRWQGRWARLRGRTHAFENRLASDAGLVCPEVFGPGRIAPLKRLRGRLCGPFIAVFHDAIPILHPDWCSRRAVAEMPVYLDEIASFDGIAAVSKDSANRLQEVLTGRGHRCLPEMKVIEPGVGFPPPLAAAGTQALDEAEPRLLMVSAVEARKNHLAFLEAAELLWKRGYRFSIDLVGLLSRATGLPAAGKIRALQETGRPLRWHGAVSEAELGKLYARAAFTVYPSLYEGYGLPVMESLHFGRPCLCSPAGALAETGNRRGCRFLAGTWPEAIAEGMRSLLDEPTTLKALRAEAKSVTLPCWSSYVDELLGFAGSLLPR